MGPSSERLRSLSGRIFTSVLVFTLGIVLVFAVALTSIFYYSYECDAEQALSEAASRAASYLDDAPASDVTTLLSQQFSGVTRYTLISENGLVLYDSQANADQMDNHASRPEVSQAARTGGAVSMRYSDTLGTDTVYAAEKLSDGRIVRLSETRHSLFAFLGEMLLPVVVALVVAAGLVFLLSRILTKHIMKPIDALDMAEPLENEIYEEMVPLLQRIDDQQTLLKKQQRQPRNENAAAGHFGIRRAHEERHGAAGRSPEVRGPYLRRGPGDARAYQRRADAVEARRKRVHARGPSHRRARRGRPHGRPAVLVRL